MGSLAGTVDPSGACGVTRRQRHHCEPAMARQADPETHPDLLAAWMAPFAGCFTRPTWANMLVLVAGALLSPGRRTVASALSSAGLRGAATFTNYHRVLNRSRWSGQAAARCLLGLLVAAFVPDGPVVGSVKNLGRYAVSWIACWRKRPSSTAALT